MLSVLFRKIIATVLMLAVAGSAASSTPLLAQAQRSEGFVRMQVMRNVPAKKAQFVLPSALAISPEILRQEPELVKAVQALYRGAEAMLASVPPPGVDNAYVWKGDRSKLENKRLLILLTTSQDPLVAEGKNRQAHNPKANSVTIRIPDGKDSVIVVCLLLDRVAFDAAGERRPDALVRLSVSLAHGLFGDLPEQLALSEEDLQKQTHEQLKEMKLRAYRATLDFIDRVRTSKILAEMEKKMQDVLLADFEVLRQGEQNAMDEVAGH